MTMLHKAPYCTDTISLNALTERPTNETVMALWQQTLKATYSWLVTTIVASSSTLLTFIERYKQRKALAALDDRLLKDIDVSRTAAEQESAKSFWQK